MWPLSWGQSELLQQWTVLSHQGQRSSTKMQPSEARGCPAHPDSTAPTLPAPHCSWLDFYCQALFTKPISKSKFLQVVLETVTFG